MAGVLAMRSNFSNIGALVEMPFSLVRWGSEWEKIQARQEREEMNKWR